MIIRSASFVKSSPTLQQCPPGKEPEFGFIGRSNVGKSSLINMLTGWNRLAKISGEPGKTRTINHFLINESWFLVDLPGYGYAKVPVSMREKWTRDTREYILGRENLVSLFVLIDSRLKPQRSDLEFMEFLGIKGFPFARVFTKCDKLSKPALEKSIRSYDEEMLKKWESVPATFLTSAVERRGREEILDYIEDSINNFSNPDSVLRE
ncbi:MAG: YihA family ribosome biogenesis GTP-binding protein [Bacteroidales bacterium]|nr:YihA family ribosome biogenesis GTP-binding protein [Bacteroidales bacterium]MBN2634294.1 YihA family ribosome biogenesis GTP-binding protein [Bacteroidales bacterium]